MVKVKGLYDGKNIRLLEKINLPKMIEVEVYFEPIGRGKESLTKQLETMKRGFDMGRILVNSREELHER